MVITPAEVAADPANRWTLELSNGGKVVIQLRPDVAPQHVYRIQLLTSHGFYNGLSFHRVISGFMAQGGDPKGTGEGGSTLPDVPAEFNDLPHLRGVASMARSEAPDSANSQFFIILSPTMKLDHKYSAFGRVIEGMAAVDNIAVGEPPAQPTKIVRATIGGPLPPPPVVTAAAPVPAETQDAQSKAAEAVVQSDQRAIVNAGSPAETPQPTSQEAPAPQPTPQETPAPQPTPQETPAPQPTPQEAPAPQPH
ncbi:peptidylprolyl isomerase [Sphingomonas sp. RB56-2]|uniref:Peptidyl-prolyl cis-trans isomerase n=1 Tax=Sphingomonas brevis TaxID=2908206 RepID=A0ABT0S857_9SPHN|nr:peptidylprolyl isomerase [Sphingomonas brevis]